MTGTFLASVQRLDLLLRRHLPADLNTRILLQPFSSIREARRFASTVDRTFGGLMRSPPSARSLVELGNALAALHEAVPCSHAAALAKFLGEEWLAEVLVGDDYSVPVELEFDHEE